VREFATKRIAQKLMDVKDNFEEISVVEACNGGNRGSGMT
jgi:hypothetical protein